MIKYWFVLSWLVVSLMCQNSQAQTPNVSKKEQKRLEKEEQNRKKKNKTLSNQDRSKLDFYFIEASTYWANNQYAQALTYFTEVLKIDDEHAAANFNVAQVLSAMGMPEKGIPYAQKAAKIDKENIWYRLILSNLFVENKQIKQATENHQKIVKDFPENAEAPYQLLSLYLQDQNYDAAINLCNDLEKKYGLNEELTFRKQKIYRQIGKNKEALIEIKRLADANPTNVDYKEMLAESYKETNQLEKSFEVLQQILTIDPYNGYALIALAQYYENKGDKVKADELVARLFERGDLSLETKIQILSSQMVKNRNNVAVLQKSLLWALRLELEHPNHAATLIIIADYYSILDSASKARKYYRHALSVSENNLRAWQALIDVSMRMRDYAEVQVDSEKALELYPNDPDFIFCNGIAYYNLKQYEKGIKSLERGIKISRNIPERIVDMYSMLGDMYNSTKNYLKSDESYDEVLKIDPKNVSVLNNYAYYLSLRKDKLDKANDMAKRAVELQPSANNMDTYGWVLFQQTKYQEAESWIKKAIDKGGVSGTVYEHYGDVMFKLNQKNDAMKYWRIAVDKKGGSRTLDQKIQTGKLDE